MSARAGLPVADRFRADGPRPTWAALVGRAGARVVRVWAAPLASGPRGLNSIFIFIEDRNSFIFYILS